MVERNRVCHLQQFRRQARLGADHLYRLLRSGIRVIQSILYPYDHIRETGKIDCSRRQLLRKHF